jgi:hypothetical protein
VLARHKACKAVVYGAAAARCGLAGVAVWRQQAEVSVLGGLLKRLAQCSFVVGLSDVEHLHVSGAWA